MATHAKKQDRRQKRQHRNKVLRRIPAEFQFDASMEMEIEAASNGVEFLAAEEGDEQKIAKFSGTAYNGGKMLVNAFYDPVVVDLSGLKVSAKSRPMLRDHNRGKIAGHTDAVTINAGSIKVSGLLSAANDESREIRESAANGFPWQLSIGATPVRSAYVGEGETVKVNGRSVTGPVIVVRQSVLKEISFLALGADDNTSVRIAASAAGNPVEIESMKFTEWLEAKGFNADDLSDAQKTSLQAMFDAEQADDGNGDPPVKPQKKKPVQAAATETDDNDDSPLDLQAQLKAERQARADEVDRVDAIKEICAKYNGPKIKLQGKEHSIEALAIKEGWDTNKTELEAMRADRPAAPAGHAHSHAADCTVEALSAAMILNFGCRLDHPVFTNSIQAVAIGLPGFLRAGIDDERRQKFMEAAHRFSDKTMLELCAEAVRIDGKSVSGLSKKETIQAAVSGSTLTNIFTTSVNARLLVGFMESPDTTKVWTQQRDVKDFKQYENIRLQKGAGLAPHPRGGQADHWSREDQQETNRIARFSRQFFIDEMDMIDDQLDALDKTPKDMGESARRTEQDIVYAVLLSNPTLNATNRALFNSTDANLDTGSALDATNLKVGVSEMMIVQENGVNLNMAPTHLLVPPARKHIAYELTNSSQILFGGDDETVRGNLNSLKADNMMPVAEARLQNGVTHPGTGVTYSGADNDWYLINNRVPTIEVAYLAGTGRAPQTSTWRKMGEDGTWGIGYACKMDVGAAAQEWRGMRKHEE